MSLLRNKKKPAGAYGWPANLADDELLRRLARLNASGGAGLP